MKLCVLILLVSPCVLGDVYMHSPRGSNNRLDEKTAQRQNANRMFNSQNNNRGGYNVGDKGSEPAGDNAEEQYNMRYFQSSESYKTLSDGEGRTFLTLEWTNQHGCGPNTATDPHKTNCNIVFQYMCQEDADTATGNSIEENVLRDGTSTSKQSYKKPAKLDETKTQFEDRFSAKVRLDRGLQETFQMYDKCYVRERNNNLFSADQNIQASLTYNGEKYSSATQTRQSPDLNENDRYGYECPEERDYYPYWHPTAWKDIAVRTYDTSLCQYYQDNSFNVRPYHECVEAYSDGEKRHFSRWNNEVDCVSVGGIWQEFHNYLEKNSGVNSEAACLQMTTTDYEYIWAVPYDSVDRTTNECLVKLPAPDCEEAEWTRTNHLGNSLDGVPNNYTWTIPFFPGLKTQRCVVRIRYNISTDDYDPWNTDASMDDISPVTDDPLVDIGQGLTPLRLNINTAQFGRTFQDRSHMFKLVPRPAGVASTDRIYNLNVRGKRGNIVQTFPAVEYDFIPNRLTMKKDLDLLHVQWTGSNTHNNNAPAGDGQSGDAGQGKGGTDRHNLVQIENANVNFPLPFEYTAFQDSGAFETVWSFHGSQSLTTKDIALQFATSGHYHCENADDCNSAPAGNGDVDVDADLNTAPASYPGLLMKMKGSGHFHYMSSRNNAFTNRSQKGRIIVVD